MGAAHHDAKVRLVRGKRSCANAFDFFPTRGRLARNRPTYNLLGFSAALAPKVHRLLATRLCLGKSNFAKITKKNAFV